MMKGSRRLIGIPSALAYGEKVGHAIVKCVNVFFYLRLRLLFSLKPKEMAKIRLLAIWIDQRQNFEISKKIVISHIQNEIFKQKNVTGSGLEGTPKLLKAFFSRLFLCENYATLEVPTLADFRSLV